MNLNELLKREIFPFVDKPARYTGGEYNSIRQSHDGKTSLCLIYPDVYEIGISNIGLKILYDRVNRESDFVCERAYAPWTDMEELLRQHRIPLFSLESRKPLIEFDVLGFSFQYEMLYTNFLNILDLSGIALYSKDRIETDPIIIGGGPVTSNSEPIAPFLDALGIGDGETMLTEILDTVRKGRQNRLQRSQILKNLSDIEGVYVPSLYSETSENGFIIPKGKRVLRRIEPSIDHGDFVKKQLVPNIQAVQDRAVIEVARGCSRGCRFCQAGIIYRPVRERSVRHILEVTREALNNTGYREFSLISLSISDYTNLPALIENLDRQFTPHGVSFSLPSLRLDSFTADLAKKVQAIRKSGLTFAVEGGSQSVRESINKGVRAEELQNVLQIAKSLGWKSVKLYFMIGLPHPKDKDEVAGIIDLISQISAAVKGIAVTISIAVFIPKPHTPYERDSQMLPEEGLNQFHRLIAHFRDNRMRHVNVRYNSPFVSQLEGVFSRGDRKLAKAIEIAFRNGARFDGWSDMLSLDIWNNAFAEADIDIQKYLGERAHDSALPWGVINSGVSESFLKEEADKSQKGELTPDCREGCTDCRVCDFKTVMPVEAQADENIALDEGFYSHVRMDSSPQIAMRFICTKKENAAYIVQVDFEELLVKSLIRAGQGVCFSNGFNPHIRMEMGWALPIGFESEFEVAQVYLSQQINPNEFINLLNPNLPDGVRVLSAKSYPIPAPKMSQTIREQLIVFRMENDTPKESIIKKRETLSHFVKSTKKGETVLNLNEYIVSLDFEEGFITVGYIQKESGARLQDIILGLLDIDIRKAVCYRPIIIRRSAWIDGHEKEILS